MIACALARLTSPASLLDKMAVLKSVDDIEIARAVRLSRGSSFAIAIHKVARSLATGAEDEKVLVRSPRAYSTTYPQ